MLFAAKSDVNTRKIANSSENLSFPHDFNQNPHEAEGAPGII
jgi:hypothetical protein